MGLDKVAVVGAGNMGSGIAQAFAAAGYTVGLFDVVPDAAARARESIAQSLARRVEAGKLSGEARDGILRRLSPAASLEAAVAGAGLVVEAVVEQLPVKQELFERLDDLCGPDVVLATNTSSFRVAEVGAVVRRPDRVLGLHFFFPAAINPLVEVIRGPASEETFRRAWGAVESLGKLPVEVADSPGFCVNRFFVPWLNEACRLMEAGGARGGIDAAAKQAFGVSMGPFALMNATGVPIAAHAQRSLHEELGSLYEPSSALVAQAAVGPWEADDGLADGVRDRLLGIVFLIAAQLVEEGVASPRDTDLAAVTGLRWAAGPFAMMNELGLAEAARLAGTIAQRAGVPVPRALQEKADAGDAWALPLVHVDFPAQHVARLRLDRPERRNSMAPDMLEALDGALDQVSQRARCIILTGRGSVFAAGADIPSMVDLDGAGAAAYTEQGARLLARLEQAPPIVVAINGAALGGGLELALAGDILMAAEGVRMGLPEVALGLHPGWGGTQRLPRRVGLGPAKDLVLTGRSIGPEEAKSIGLVNHVVPRGELAEAAVAVAKKIAGHAPLAVAAAKRTLNCGASLELEQGLDMERDSVVTLFDTKDKREGLQAFLERRQPNFRGA